MARDTQIISIASRRDAQPKKGTWYQYDDQTLVSVICSHGRKSHVRGKNGAMDSRRDNGMSEWHRRWQYDFIEDSYGQGKSGKRTYEIPIKHLDEHHIIDSLVNGIAIEFQHTLSVAVQEMDSRFLAQKAQGHTPYLVLNFTDHAIPLCTSFPGLTHWSFKDLKRQSKLTDLSDSDKAVFSKMAKWTEREHYKHGNLFVDFADGMVRCHPELNHGHHMLDIQTFLNDLKSLDTTLREQITAQTEERERHKIAKETARKAWIEQERLEANRKKEEAETAKAEAYAMALRENKKAKNHDSKFAHFRKIVKHPLLSHVVLQYDFDNLLFHEDSVWDSIDGTYIERHIYFCREEQLLFSYQNRWHEGKTTGLAGKFLSSEIRLVKRKDHETKTFIYVQNAGESFKPLVKKVELADGYLHSLYGPAKITYDEQGKPAGKQYYVFNHLIEADIFKPAEMLFTCMGMLDTETNKGLTDDQRHKLSALKNKVDADSDEYGFIRGIISNAGLYTTMLQAYYQDKTIEFLSRLEQHFYIGDTDDGIDGLGFH